MILLSLTCGRNASATLVKEGRVLVHILRERVARRRHALGLCQETVARAFQAANLAPDDVDFCVLVGDHDEPLVIEKGGLFGLKIEGSDIFHSGVSYQDSEKTWEAIAWKKGSFAGDGGGAVLGSMEDYVAGPIQGMVERRLTKSLPLQAFLAGREKPGFLVDHHAAHAAASFYASPFEKALVLTHDSGEGADSGFLFYGNGAHLFPIAPHGLQIARLYDEAAACAGLQGRGGAGKFMGLSSYGVPLPGLAALAGTIQDWRKRFGAMKPDAEIRANLLSFLCDAVAARGDTLVGFGEVSRLPFPGASNFAASVQVLFSETLFQTALRAAKALKTAGKEVNGLCLGGGAALNCPTNTRLALNGGFGEVFIPPHTENGGLSIGAAWWVLHNVLNVSSVREKATTSRYAMLGALCSEKDIEDALGRQPDLTGRKSSAPAQEAARDLASGLFVGWFEGESEIGPRALGHRSLLADPRGKGVALRMNAIKGREKWRPFAPVCPAESLSAWFDEGPAISPFMLFTYKVRKDKQGQIPAVTHVDGSARVQTAVKEDGRIYEILKAFEKETGVPVLLNTSFNGANEPIVETPADALRFFLKNGLDVLYLGDYRLAKATLK